MRALSLALTCCLIVACAGPSAPAAPTLEAARRAIGKIQLCRTEPAELEQRFGRPMRDGRLHHGRILSWVLGKDKAERILAVLILRGVVVDIYWDVPGAADWVPADQCSAPASLPSR